MDNSPAILSASDNEIPLHEFTAALRKTLVPKFGEGETRAIIRLIFHHLKGWNTTDLVINELTPISPFIQSETNKIIERLLNDEPIQYITGEAYFYGMDMEVSPGVLIPRPETEELVDMIVKQNQQPDLHILDACTGSGCIAIALARNIPFATVDAVDISDKAVETARHNADKLKAKVNVIKKDIFSYQPDDESLDVIVSNPPYIGEAEKKDMERNVLEFEPHEALFVPDSDPLKFYRRIAETGTKALKRGGQIYFELNPLHADELKKLMTFLGYDDINLHLDIHRRKRFLSAKRGR